MLTSPESSPAASPSGSSSPSGWSCSRTVGALSSKLIDVQNNEASSWLPESAESTEVLEELSDTVDPNDIPTLVVYNKESGLTDEDLAAMDEQAQEMAKIDGVTDQGALSPNVAAAAQEQGQPGPQLLSEDGQVAYIYLVFNFGENGWNDIPDAVDEIRDIADIDGVTVHMAGFGGQAADSAEAFEGIDTNLIMITLLVVIVILLFTYRSPILWLLPIISAVVAYSVSGGVVYLLAKYADLTVNGQSQAIMGILVIGAGTDYALLLTARYREELRRHEDRHEAMAFALHRAAPAILASAATVAAGMLCLIIADLNSTAGLGPVNAVAVGRHLPRDGDAPPGPAGDLRPLDVLAQAPRLRHARADEHRVLGEGRQRHPAASPQGVDGDHRHPAALPASACSSSTRPGCRRRSSTPRSSTRSRGRRCSSTTVSRTTPTPCRSSPTPTRCPRSRRPSERSTAWASPRRRRTSAMVGPTSRPRSGRTSHRPLRSTSSRTPEMRSTTSSGADALVGGGSAFWLDTKIASERDNKVIIPVVLVVVFLILMLLLRALISPLLLMATVVLSFGAALGISTLLFTEVFTRLSLFEVNEGFAHTDAGFPLFAFVFLVALGIDYNIFLMTRVREEAVNHGTRQGLADRAVVDGRRDHLGRRRAGGHLPGARLAAAGVPGAAGCGRRSRRAARHLDRALGAGHRAQPRRRGQDLVAEQARQPQR